MAKSKAEVLRELLNADEPEFIPGVGNALEARIMEAVGFKALTMSGAMTALYYGGFPDLGIMTMTEVVAVATRMQEAVSIPIIIDCDNGYGNAITARRTAEQMIKGGVAGIQFEDQAGVPKRLFTDPNLRVLPIEEAVGKLTAVADVRRELGSDVVIVGRCDAVKAVNGGMDEVIRRVREYGKVGADAIFCPNLSSRDQYLAIREAAGVPIISAFGQYRQVVPTPKTPKDLGALGMGGVYVIETLAIANVVGMWDAAAGRLAGGMAWDETFKEQHKDHPVGDLFKIWELAGLQKYVDYERKYITGATK